MDLKSRVKMNKAILIDNVVVSTNLQGTIRLTPVSILAKRGIDFSDVPRRTYGSRLLDNAMIQSLIEGLVTFDDAINLGH